jgi:hypothetical protein
MPIAKEGANRISAVFLVGRDHNLNIHIARHQRATCVRTEEPNLIDHAGVPTTRSDIDEKLFEALGRVLSLH